MIKVFFDSQPLNTGHSIRGIGSYTKNLLEVLKENRDIELVQNTTEADVVHYPYFDLFFNTLKLSAKPTVITVFDTIPLIYPDKYHPGIKGNFRLLLQKKRLSKAATVITISETSKKDIVRFLDVPQEKIFPIHLAPNPVFRRLATGNWQLEIAKRYTLPKRFVLYVGDVNYNKNVLGLAKACKLIKVSLVIVGKQAANSDFDKVHIENQPLVQLIEEYGNDPDIMRLGFVPEEDLVKIYNLATVYCQPSFYEGFGLPVLEAMACGVQIVASRTQALVEIAEGAAVFFNPYNPKDTASVLGDILTKPGLQKTLSEKGLSHVKNFFWEKTASQTINVYKKVVNG